MPDGERRVAGYTEASRGCKHLCRHCPIVPVYNGVFRIVPREVVLEDIRRQVDAGAEHITFGDPDFFNGPAHALAIVEALHREFPRITYDVTIKIEHLLRSPAEDLAKLARYRLSVRHQRRRVGGRRRPRAPGQRPHARRLSWPSWSVSARSAWLLQPTFVPFTPWTTLDGYRDLLEVIAAQNLVENVAPIQLGIRLLIPAGSRLLELRRSARHGRPVRCRSALVYPWRHADPRMDALAARVQELAATATSCSRSRAETFALIWQAAAALGSREPPAGSSPRWPRAPSRTSASRGTAAPSRRRSSSSPSARAGPQRRNWTR